MNGRRTLATILVVTALVAFGMVASTAQAAPDRLRLVLSNTGTSHVLEAYDVPEPGLGSWTVDVTYDTGIVELMGCNGQKDTSICSPVLTENSARVTGTSPPGLTGDSISLAVFFFNCHQAGTAEITFDVQVWTNADGEAVDVSADPASVVCGGVDQTPAPGSTANATPAPALPSTGAGPSGGIAWPWPAAVMLATGASLLALAAVRRSHA